MKKLSPQANPPQAGNTPDKHDTLDRLYSLDRLSPQANPPSAGDTLSTLFFYLAILIFIIGFNFTDSPPPFGWYQQFMPNIGGRNITDIFFLDSLTGWAVTNATNQSNDTTYVLKTTNGGDNWIIQYRKIQTGGGFYGLSKVYFLNQSTGYICGVDNGPISGFAKSTDGGISWSSINVPDPSGNYLDMSIMNINTQWLVTPDPLGGGVFLTTNGGANWTQQFSAGIDNSDHIYMFNARIGFIAKTNSYTRKTTDGGQSWFILTNGSGEGFYDMYFADSLLGWGAFYNMRKTTNGGINWIVQTLPSGGNILVTDFVTFSNINIDTIWGAYGIYLFPNNQARAFLFRTTNSGDNWLFQIPDTSIHIGSYSYVNFVNKVNGWAYRSSSTGIHTVTGGDTTWYTGIVQHSKDVPKDFVLKQNYPNPFNPRTVIPYSLKSAGYVRIIAYDILGREVQRLVDGKQSAGEYEVDFMGKFCSSGVYFYRMTVDGNVIGTKKMLMLK